MRRFWKDDEQRLAPSGLTMEHTRNRQEPKAWTILSRSHRVGNRERMALGSELTRLAVCELETIGRRSGEPRRIEIWFAADPERDRIYLLSGGRDQAHWVRNIRRNGRVRVRIGSRWFDGQAAEVMGGADDGLARRLLAAKYQGWVDGSSLSAWARDSLPIAVDLAASEGLS
jgi:deazaflavin-dependent oxidoreductase (nitroreductase family)